MSGFFHRAAVLFGNGDVIALVVAITVVAAVALALDAWNQARRRAARHPEGDDDE